MSFKSYIAIPAVMLALAACSDVDLPETPASATAGNLTCTAEGHVVDLTWTLPAGNAIESVELYRDQKLVATLPADATSYSFPRESAGQEHLYTVKIKYADGLVSQGVTVACSINAPAPVPAMLLPVASVEQLEDDDEKAAAEWFARTYPEGKFLTSDDLPGLDPFAYSCVWINIDREDLSAGWRKLPKTVSGTPSVNALKEYISLGGNIFLTKHATQMTVPLGFQSAVYAPGIFSSGQGGEGNDNWAMNANIGIGKYDHRNHDIFRGLTTLPDYGHETFAMEGPGWREDHNCMWDLNSYGLDPSPDTVAAFEKANDCTVLATWAHVTDFAVAGILEFNATAERPGRCIAIGLSAYEFRQNTGNPFQSNIETLTKNCIEYLK